MTDEERIKQLGGYFERGLFHSPQARKELSFFEMIEQLRFDSLTEIADWLNLIFRKYDILEIMHGCRGDCCCSLLSNFIFIVLALSNKSFLNNFQKHGASYSEDEKRNIAINFGHFMEHQKIRQAEYYKCKGAQIRIDINYFNKFIKK